MTLAGADPDQHSELQRLAQIHDAYKHSILGFAAAPEYTTGEVLLSSTCRTLGLADADEATIDLEQIRDLPRRLAERTAIPAASWEALLADHGALRSPAFGGQKASRQLPQLTPIVPALTTWTGVLGKPRNRWVPGNLVLAALSAGAGPDEFARIVAELKESLSTSEHDDMFARFLESQLRTILGPNPHREPPWRPSYIPHEGHEQLSPPERLVADLRHILDLKPHLTRRHWTTLVEAVLRLGMGAYVLWLCRLNEVVWSLTQTALSGEVPEDAVISKAIESAHLDEHAFFELEGEAVPALRRTIRAYAAARYGINVVLWRLEDANVGYPSGIGKTAGTPSAPKIREFLLHVRDNAARLGANPLDSIRAQVFEILNENSAQVSARKGGPFKNLFEFTRYTLGQLRPADETRRPYDQAFTLAPRGKTWVVNPGPVTLYALIYAATRNHPEVPLTLDDFRTHLAEYGVKCPAGSFEKSQTITRLSQLGVLLDSPDAVGGRVLLNPFRRIQGANPR